MSGERDREQAFVEEIKNTLTQKGEKLDPDVLVRLSAIRGHAVESSRYRFGWFWRMARVPAAAFMTVAFCLMFALVFYRAPATISSFSAFEDVEILVAEDGPDFFADLDFYTWLAEESDV